MTFKADLYKFWYFLLTSDKNVWMEFILPGMSSPVLAIEV